MLSRSPAIALATFIAGTVLIASTAGCGSSAPAPAPAQSAQSAQSAPAASGAARLPDTPAGRQASWLTAAVARWPIPAAQLGQHFDRAFLAQVTPAKLDTALHGVGSIRVDSVTSSAPRALLFVITANGVTRLNVNLTVDGAGLISGLLLQPAVTSAQAPATWSGIDKQVRAVAPQTRLLVASVTGASVTGASVTGASVTGASVTGGACVPIHAIDAQAPAPLGSAFKLYVLDALARAIAAGRVSWNQPLTITGQVKSLPSGTLQDRPDGSTVTVRQAAAGMISVSDNTAADMLIGLVGRAAVEAAARATGMADPALDTPFLTTRELFVLKLDDWPVLANRYLALDAGGRLAMLASTIDSVPVASLRSAAATWTAPRDVSGLEWFASADDICRVYASLAALARQPRLAPLSAILSINSGDMNLDQNLWRPAWFKGGSEPGVLTLNYLDTTRAGRTFVVSVLAQNPAAPIGAAATPALIGAATSALRLAAGT